LIGLPRPNAGERKPRFRYAQWLPDEIAWTDVETLAASTPR